MTDHRIHGKTVLIAGGAKNLGGLLARDLAASPSITTATPPVPRPRPPPRRCAPPAPTHTCSRPT